MGIFGIKSKAEKEQERKMLVRKSMRELENRINKLKEQEAKYVKAAQIAIREELPEQIALAKHCLQITIAERKRTYKMLLNAQILSQMKDTTAMTKQFLDAVHVISKDIAATAGVDMSKLSEELRVAMDKVSDQTAQLEDMMSESQDSFSEFSSEKPAVTDDKLDQMIYGNASAGESSGASDSFVNSEMEELRKMLQQ